MSKKYIIEHSIVMNDVGNFTGWEIINEKLLMKYRTKVESLKKAFDEGFLFELFFINGFERYDYKMLMKIFKSVREITIEEEKVIKKFTPQSEWNLLEEIYDDIDEQFRVWKEYSEGC